MVIVTDTDVKKTLNTSATVTTSSGQLLPTRLGRHRRVAVTITNLSPTTVYIVQSDSAAISGTGVPLQQNQSLTEADDGGYRCYQGAYQAIATASSSIAILETFEG